MSIKNWLELPLTTLDLGRFLYAAVFRKRLPQRRPRGEVRDEEDLGAQ